MRGRGKEIKLKRIEEKERWIEGEKLDWSIMGDLVGRVGQGILCGKKENTSPQLIMCAENASTNNHK